MVLLVGSASFAASDRFEEPAVLVKLAAASIGSEVEPVSRLERQGILA